MGTWAHRCRLAIGLWAVLGLAGPSARAGPPTDDWGRVGTTRDCNDNCRTFLVNFVILAPVAFEDAEAKMQAEIDILNQYFRTKEGYQLFHFVKKKVTTYEDVRHLRGCRKLKALGHLKHELDSGNHRGERKTAMDECFASSERDAGTLFDHHAINFYVFDNHGSRGSSGGAHRTRTKRWPFLLIDHARLGHVNAVEEHEMGHALAGLEHLCVVDVAEKGPSPIMATPNHWPGGTSSCRSYGGRMGLRNIGFSDEAMSHLESAPHREIAQIVAEADKVQSALGAEGSPPPGSPPQW